MIGRADVNIQIFRFSFISFISSFVSVSVPMPGAGCNGSLAVFLAVEEELELEKRLLVGALISPLTMIIITIRRSGRKREHGPLWKEACTQLLSAIKTQICEDEPAHRLQSTHPVVWRDISPAFVRGNQRALDRLVSRHQRKDCLVIRRRVLV